MSSSSAHPIIKGGYYPSWDQNVNIPTQNFTHIFYAFLNPKDDDDFQFKIDDGRVALLKTFTATLQAKSPPVKVLFAVGGADEAVAPLLSRMASVPASRAKFISSSISVARRLGFDGVDLDWEFPQDKTEMENLGALLKEWRLAVTVEANSTGRRPLLLTAAVYYRTTITWPTYTRRYPVSIMSTNLDFINVMAYDYHGSRETKTTCAFAALYDPTGNLCTESGINSWTTDGAPPEKLIMGLPLYGRTWKLEEPARANGIGAPENGLGPGDGAMTYAQVVQFNQVNKARVVYDEATVSVYSVAGSDWISYDDPRSVCAKVEYAKGRGLGGHFFWQVAGDYQRISLSQAASDSWKDSVQEI